MQPPRKMYQAEVFYTVDKMWDTVIASSDVFPTKKEALEDLAAEWSCEIAFQACSIRQDEGIENPFLDESDVEGCMMMVACHEQECSEDDDLAYNLVKSIESWIKKDFEGDTGWPHTGSIFDGRVKEVNVYLEQ